jgi:phosphatidylserine decarboxylase
VSIFLSPLDVHINRSPVSGRVERVEYHAGSFLPAYRREARDNERSEVWIDHDGQPVIFRQVVGVLARRIVCRLAPGDVVRAGDRVGLMKFGSRMDVFLPSSAILLVAAGDHVRGGETRIARLPSHG